MNFPRSFAVSRSMRFLVHFGLRMRVVRNKNTSKACFLYACLFDAATREILTAQITDGRALRQSLLGLGWWKISNHYNENSAYSKAVYIREELLKNGSDRYDFERIIYGEIKDYGLWEGWSGQLWEHGKNPYINRRLF